MKNHSDNTQFMALVRAVSFCAPMAYARAFAAWLAVEAVLKMGRAQKAASAVMLVTETVTEAELASRWERATKASKPAVQAFAAFDLACEFGRQRAQMRDDGFDRALASFEQEVPVGSYTDIELIASAAPKLTVGGPCVREPRPNVVQHVVL